MEQRSLPIEVGDRAQNGGPPAVLDGGLATELERRGADLSDRLWSARLLVDDPDLIREVHLDYFRAGAQVATTATYQASLAGFAARGIDPARAAELMRRAVRLARSARDQADRGGLLIAASIGPYGAMRADGSEYTGEYAGASVDDLIRFHRPRIDALAATGPDLFAAETIPSMPETEALAFVLSEVPEIPSWVSFSCRDGARIADGTFIEDAARMAASVPSVIAVGINCTPARLVTPLLTRLYKAVPIPLIVYPNAGGRWDASRRAWSDDAKTVPEDLTQAANTWLGWGVRWVGGCCGFGVRAIEALARSVAHTA
jgi:homocysteine S-methyltransferase